MPASPATAVVLVAGTSSQTKFPGAKRVKNNSVMFSRTTLLIVSRSLRGPATCRDIGGSVDFARPTTPSPVGCYLLRAIDPDPPRGRPGIPSRQVSLESRALSQRADHSG